MFSHSDSKSSCEGLRLNLQVGLLTVRALLGAKLTLQQHHPTPCTAMQISSSVNSGAFPLVTPRTTLITPRCPSDSNDDTSSCAQQARQAPRVARKKRASRRVQLSTCGDLTSRCMLQPLDENMAVSGPLDDESDEECGGGGSGGGSGGSSLCFGQENGAGGIHNDYCPPERKSKNVLFTPR